MLAAARISRNLNLGQLAPDTSRWLTDVAIRVVLYEEGATLGAFATSLLSYLWLELANSMNAGTAFERACRQCGAIFIIDHLQGFRRNRDFCADKCRVAAHKEKVREAKALRAAGVSLAEIAKRLETRAATVRGWTAKRKRKGM